MGIDASGVVVETRIEGQPCLFCLLFEYLCISSVSCLAGHLCHYRQQIMIRAGDGELGYGLVFQTARLLPPVTQAAVGCSWHQTVLSQRGVVIYEPFHPIVVLFHERAVAIGLPSAIRNEYGRATPVGVVIPVGEKMRHG